MVSSTGSFLKERSDSPRCPFIPTFAAMNPSPQSEPYPNTKPNLQGAVSAATQAGGLGTEIDLGLVRRMAAGDEQALSAFYGRWFPIVNALSTRMLTSADDV